MNFLAPICEIFTNKYFRNASYGGRTKAKKTYCRVKQGDEIRYEDVITLYPYICKYGKFHVDQKKVYVGADCPPYVFDKEGIMKCKVLPPRKLYHLMLPYMSNYKPMFTLCYACADTKKQGKCTHTDGERCIVGTWAVDEVREAIGMGYILVNVYEFWEYEITCFY